MGKQIDHERFKQIILVNHFSYWDLFWKYLPKAFKHYVNVRKYKTKPSVLQYMK